ncbi:glycosyltransferase [Sulfitobacter sp.]|uniref:glycosyltransferase n=1 Tax=Sulfitobacter sp. TaxID=1903071 RepID=UPI0030015FAD
MKVLFTSTKGTGHARPLLPYIAELQRLGHDVHFAAPEQLRDMFEKRSIPFTPLSRVPEEDVQARFAAARDMPKDEIPKWAIQEFFVRLWAGDAMQDLSALVTEWSPDLIVRESAEFAAPIVAAKTKTPCVRVEVHNSPGESLFIEHGAAPLDELRQSAGLPADNGKSLMTERAFTSFPKSFDPKTDWNDRPEPFRVNSQSDVGSPSLKRPAWAPDNGQPFVYVTFGTVAGNEAEERAAYQTALEAVGNLPINALLTTGINMDGSLLTDIPDNVIVEAWVPQDDVFSYASAIVHHCGSGTLIGALAAGLPSIAVPLFADQPSNAEQIEKIGAGVAVFDLDVASLQNAIMRVLDDDSFRVSSERCAKEIAVLPTIEDAIEEMCK